MSLNTYNVPKVSIIVPTYNVEKYADFCFASLINQKLEDIEIILVDDGSTDSSGEICEKYASLDSRIIVVHQNNKGLGYSRNTGIEIARGEYVGFVDSDDCVSTSMFQILYENAHKYNADVSYCEFKKFYDEKSICEDIENKDIHVFEGKNAIHQYLLNRIGLPPKCKKDSLYGTSVCKGIFSNKLIKELNARFVSERQFISEDMIFNIDIIPFCNTIVHSDKQLYYYRFNPNSLTTVYKADRYKKNVQLYHEMYRRLLSNYEKDECFISMSRYLLTTARIAIMHEAAFVRENKIKGAINNIRLICESKELIEILQVYNYKELPFKYRVTCYLIKKKNSVGLLFLYILYNWRKKY